MTIKVCNTQGDVDSYCLSPSAPSILGHNKTQWKCKSFAEKGIQVFFGQPETNCLHFSLYIAEIAKEQERCTSFTSNPQQFAIFGNLRQTNKFYGQQNQKKQAKELIVSPQNEYIQIYIITIKWYQGNICES